MQFGYFQGAIQSPWMCCTTTSNEGTSHSSAYVACFVSRLGSNKYLNLADDVDMTFDQLSQEAALIEKIHQFTILKYEVKDGMLILTLVDDSFIRDAIKKGQIKGDE